LRDLTTGCWGPLRRLKRGPMELSAPSRYATRMSNSDKPAVAMRMLFDRRLAQHGAPLMRCDEIAKKVAKFKQRGSCSVDVGM
jgi:hypothetical protein